MKIAFNTGRMYTNDGQRIAAWVEVLPEHGIELCFFVDFDRMICESFPITMRPIGSWLELAEHVMYMYDSGQYRCGPYIRGAREMCDLVYRKGWDAWVKQEGVRMVNYRDHR